MIISRTPFRMSFFGGGTDYPAYFRHHPGAVLSTTIDKYCYLTTRYLPPFFEHKTRVIYSKVENVRSTDEIQHPSVRECLRFLDIQEGLEIHHDADLPARSGLGSSSAFTVGLLHALYALGGQMASKQRLAADAIEVEQHRIAENVGSQDQIAAAYGGLNRIDFHPDGSFTVHPVILGRQRREQLQSHLLLFFTGFARNASDVAAEQIQKTPDRGAELARMYAMVSEGIEILQGKGSLEPFGDLLHEAWTLKRGLTTKITTPTIDGYYARARDAGALGGKLLGAGGGGFMALFVRPKDQPRVLEAMQDLLHVPFRFESQGSQIVFYEDQPVPSSARAVAGVPTPRAPAATPRTS